MCGLVAVVPKYNTRGLTHQEMTVFETLVTIDTLRGEDSTGIFTANFDTVEIVKDALTGPQLLQEKEYKDLRATALKNGKFVVAHNRKATRGTINDRNAHPFYKDNKVVMVHNGTFVGDHKKHADTEVDSEAMCHLLADHAVDQVDTVLGKVSAAYALIWFDARDDSLNIIRNNERPLYVWETNTAWYFSSEAIMLHFAMMRSNVTTPDKSRPEMLEEHEHYKFVFDKTQTSLGKTKLKLPFRNEEHDLENWYQNYGTGYRGGKQIATSPNRPLNHNTNACAYDTKSVVESAGNAANTQQQPPAHVHTSVQHEQRLQQHAKQDSVTGSVFSDKIVDDACTVTMLPFGDYPKYREQYTHGAEIEFDARNIVPLDNKDYIIYGTCDTDENVFIGAQITNDDFNKLIEINNKRQRLKGRIQAVVFKNLITTVNVEDMSGAFIVKLNTVSKVEPEGEHCGC